MKLTLNQLIEKLIAVRDANPALGETVPTMEDQELGTMYPVDVKDVEVDASGVMLTAR